jgi:hypothetical protein
MANMIFVFEDEVPSLPFYDWTKRVATKTPPKDIIMDRLKELMERRLLIVEEMKRQHDAENYLSRQKDLINQREMRNFVKFKPYSKRMKDLLPIKNEEAMSSQIFEDNKPISSMDIIANEDSDLKFDKITDEVKVFVNTEAFEVPMIDDFKCATPKISVVEEKEMVKNYLIFNHYTH